MCEWNPIRQNDLFVCVCVRILPFYIMNNMDLVFIKCDGDIKVSFVAVVVVRRQIEIGASNQDTHLN